MTRLFATTVATVSAIAFALLALSGASGGEAAGPPTFASALGRADVDGHEAYVHVTVAALSGTDARSAAEAALARRGAVAVQSAAYSTNGKWRRFGDTSSSSDFVPQSYYVGTEPFAGARDEFTAAAQMWNDVATSKFAFMDEGNTTTCPSLVLECGNQATDGEYGMGWLDLGGVQDGSIILDVTWYIFRGPVQEADMALNSNTAITWVIDNPADPSDDPAPGPLTIDVRTVASHEDGHFAGVGHSNDVAALMYPYYQGPMWALAADDTAAITKLYPTSSGGDSGGGGAPGYCKKHPERTGCP